jgi:5'-methylthioadenosine nucleosidase
MAAMKKLNKVCFLVAMEQESAPFIAALGLKKRSASGPAPVIVHEGTYKGAAVVVYNPGMSDGKSLVGTDFATLATFLAAERDAPDLFVNAGTCGGFAKRGGAVGDVYCVSSFQHHDRRVPIPGYDAMCVGKRAAAAAPRLVAALGAKTGPCTTGNSLDCSPTDAEIIEASGAVCKDMEAAAIAWAAELTGTPLLGIKVVTDIVDGEHPTQDEFLANLAKASDSLQGVLPKVLDFVVDKTLAEL